MSLFASASHAAVAGFVDDEEEGAAPAPFGRDGEVINEVEEVVDDGGSGSNAAASSAEPDKTSAAHEETREGMDNMAGI